MLQIWMLGIFQVVENCTCRDDACVQILFHSEPLKTMGTKMFQ